MFTFTEVGGQRRDVGVEFTRFIYVGNMARDCYDLQSFSGKNVISIFLNSESVKTVVVFK